MSLLTLVVAEGEVNLPDGQSFKVRALNLTDLVKIFQKYANYLEDIFQQRAAAATDGSPLDMQSSLVMLLEVAPQVAYEVIALADPTVTEDDMDKAVAAVGSLPATSQLMALVEVVSLTLHSEEELEKLLGMLTQGTNIFTRLVGIVDQRPQKQ